jgi:hypothetical protein
MYLPRHFELAGAVASMPDGTPGIMLTIRRMRQLVREGRVNPEIRRTAINLTTLLPPRDFDGEIRTLFEFVRDRIRYVGDVNEIETLTAPDKTLHLGAGDCDDKAVLLASLLESIGYSTVFIVTGYTLPGVFEHVYLAVLLPDGSLLPLDASEPQAPGWEPPNAVAYHLERLS